MLFRAKQHAQLQYFFLAFLPFFSFFLFVYLEYNFFFTSYILPRQECIKFEIYIELYFSPDEMKEKVKSCRPFFLIKPLIFCNFVFFKSIRGENISNWGENAHFPQYFRPL